MALIDVAPIGLTAWPGYQQEHLQAEIIQKHLHVNKYGRKQLLIKEHQVSLGLCHDPAQISASSIAAALNA